MAELRTKLFLSYSKADTEWRDAFRRQLSAMFVSDDLWIDCDSIPEGSDWEQQITQAIEKSLCALVLMTPAYLDNRHYARRELALLLAQTPALKLLPVLVEDCPWSEVDKLDHTQFVGWPGGLRKVASDDGTREELRPLAEAPQRDRSIIEICRRTKRELGVVGQATPEQIDTLFSDTQRVLGDQAQLQQAVHSGTFSVVYRASMHGETVAIKVVPDAPRQNRIRLAVTAALPKLSKLSDPAFIRLRYARVDTEPHCFVMDYVDWPTLDLRMASAPGRRLAPAVVAVILAQVARAHRDAHRQGLQVGPLSLGSVHASDDWDVRFSPLRIEGLLARAANMATGQLMNWDALTYLAPEISAGHASDDVGHLDSLEQYYLGLLGLELLLGKPPCEVRCFDDLMIKAQFFDDPRTFFDDGRGDPVTWVDSSPALAYLLIRLLARQPEQRLANADAVVHDLEALAEGAMPSCLRRQLDADIDRIMEPEFTDAFYTRLLAARPALTQRFGDRAAQARMLGAALPDLLAFDPEFSRNSRFAALVDRHAGYGIDADDVEAFRASFLAQVDFAFEGRAGHVEAWRAALDRGLAVFGMRLAAGAQ
jgi:TIR domain/Protein tyrosine and serine/threonine kinase